LTGGFGWQEINYQPTVFTVQRSKSVLALAATQVKLFYFDRTNQL